MIAKWYRITFLYFVIVALLGIFMRWLLISPVEGVNFQYILHAHSHLAILGWIFNLLFAALISTYIPDKIPTYNLLFWLLQIAVLGMLFTFPFQGYAAASIVFSTLHILLSWAFAAKFFRNTAHLSKEKSLSFSFARWSLIFMVFSSIGPFAVGALMANGMAGTPPADLAIYFYLHFQYNGWFTFAVLALFFRLLEENNIRINRKYGIRFLVLMIISCVPGYALSALWTQPALWVYVVGFVAAVLQLIAFGYLVLIIKEQKSEILKLVKKPQRYLLQLSFLAFAIKITMQFASAFPEIADLAYKARNFTIGYLHIVFIGFVTLFLLFWLFKKGIFNIYKKKVRLGVLLFLIGFIISELLIFLQPSFILLGWGALPFGNEAVFAVSLLMPLGIILFSTHVIFGKNPGAHFKLNE